MDYSDILEFLDSKLTERTEYSWRLWAERDELRTQEFAEMVAMLIVAYRCGARVDRFEAWLDKTNGGIDHAEPTLSALRILISSAVGLPAEPRSPDLVQAMVAEHLWFFVHESRRAFEPIERIEGPSVDVTDPGGDGLVVYHVEEGRYSFRLWEIKKHVSTAAISTTVRRAYVQLEKRAPYYLNKHSLLGQHLEPVSPELARFYGKLLDLWVEGADAAAAGVAVASNAGSVPTKCFSSFPRRFPMFRDPNRLEGMIAAVVDFQDFSDRVRNTMWNGL